MKLDLGDAFLIFGVVCLAIGIGFISWRVMLVVIGSLSFGLGVLDLFGTFDKRGKA